MAISGFLLSVFIGIISIFNFVKSFTGVDSFEQKNVIAIMCFILFSAVTSALLLSLLILQFYLIGKNLTTNEYLKNTYASPDNPNPFDEGCSENFRMFLTKSVKSKQINLVYLQKRMVEQNKTKSGCEFEIGNYFENLSNSNKKEKEEKKIQENLLV